MPMIDEVTADEVIANKVTINKEELDCTSGVTNNDVINNDVTNNDSLDTSRLSVGDVVKNYIELCKLLGENQLKGDSKKYQLKNWQRFFSFEKIKGKQSFLILDIYDEPLEKSDERKKGNNSIYSKYIETILVNYLSNIDDNTKTFTRRNWWELLGMINRKYGKLTNAQIKNIDSSITDFEISHFYQRCNRKLDTILITALNSLRRRRLIEWEYQTVVVYGPNQKHSVATDSEVENILKTEKYFLNEIFGYEDMYQIYLYNRQKEFYNLVNDFLLDNYGYHRYYRRIKIIYNQENMIDALPVTELQLQKLMLNNEISNYLTREARRIRKNWKYNSEYYLVNDCPKLYLQAQQLLVNELIKPTPSGKVIDLDLLIDKMKEETPEDQEELDELFGTTSSKEAT